VRVQVGEGKGPERKLVDGKGDDTAGSPIVKRGEALTAHGGGQPIESPLQAGQVPEQERHNDCKQAYACR